MHSGSFGGKTKTALLVTDTEGLPETPPQGPALPGIQAWLMVEFGEGSWQFFWVFLALDFSCRRLLLLNVGHFPASA